MRGGRAAVREILFIVASVVGRHEPDFIAFQQRLRAAGKPPKVVRIALAHKLLVRLNAKAREVRQRLAAPYTLMLEPVPTMIIPASRRSRGCGKAGNSTTVFRFSINLPLTKPDSR